MSPRSDPVTTFRHANGTVRGIITGPAGSGKTESLERLRSALERSGVGIGALDQAQSDDVVLVDDADTIDAAALARLHDLAADPSRSIVAAFRERAASPLAPIARRLERSGAILVLGETTAAEVASAASLSPVCVDAILTQTGGLTWLTAAAVAAHTSAPDACELDPMHRHLADRLHGLIAYRTGCLDAPTRAAVEMLALLPHNARAAAHPPDTDWDAAILEGWSAGILTRSGEAPPAVRAALRADLPAHRVPELLNRAGLDSVFDLDGEHHDDETVHGDRASRLLARGDRVRATDPMQAIALYGEALAAGTTAAQFALRFAIATAGIGDLDTAASCVDRILRVDDHPSADDAIDVALALWAARGALRAGVAAHGHVAARTGAARARRAIARIAVGHAPEVAGEESIVDTDTLGVASAALTTAITTSLGDAPQEAVDDLVVASELYSAAHSDVPLVEPPAVVAAAAALAAGAPATAVTALTAAMRAQQGGLSARPRLLLWQVWMSIVAGHADDARARLDHLHADGPALSPRDRLIAAACNVALARRYGNQSALAEAMREAIPLLVTQRFDLFLHPFLAEFVLAGQRVEAPPHVDRLFDAEVAGLTASGGAPLWSVPLHWTGIQRGIAHKAPDMLIPHARALIAASSHSAHAAHLADAGRVWTAVLTGEVDATRVEHAAHLLARDGLRWDGARLCAYAATRATDRLVGAQLLGVARDLHPRVAVPTQVTGDQERSDDRPETRTPLSAREIEVSRLVLQGKTYVEIGQTLYISPRTAEHHIARIRRRLEATSRADLIAKLRAVIGDDRTRREGAA